MINIYDVSGFLYALTDGAMREGLNTTGLELLMYRMLREQNCLHVLVLDPKKTNRVAPPNSTYKANRDGKPFEVEIMEDFLETFKTQLNIHVVRAPEGYEADDLIYSLVRHYNAVSFHDIHVYSDDRDLAGCIISKKVTKKAITSNVPDVIMATYATMCVREKFVPYNLIAGYTIAYGKKSDNIKEFSAANEVLYKLDDEARKFRDSNNDILVEMYHNASSIEVMRILIEKAFADDQETKEQLLERAELACLHTIQGTFPEVNFSVSLRENAVYTALRCIRSKIRPRDRNKINEALLEEMDAFFDARYQPTSDMLDLDVSLDAIQIPEANIDVQAILSNKFQDRG